MIIELHYTSIEEAREWLGSKIALYGGANAQDTDIEDDLAVAESLVDTYVSNHYETPLTDEKLIRLVKGYVKWFFLEQAFTRSASGEAPESVTKAVDRTTKQLEAISAGKQRLGGVEPKSHSPAAGSIIVTGAEPTRDAEALRDY